MAEDRLKVRPYPKSSRSSGFVPLRAGAKENVIVCPLVDRMGVHGEILAAGARSFEYRLF
jgi:hypothetical protein